jgi:hypothetical protein
MNIGGIQLAAFLVRRCLFESSEVCVWIVFPPCDEVLQGML